MSRNLAHGLILIVALIWGTTFIAQTTGMDTIGPLSFTGARYLIGVLVILPLALWEWRRVSLLQAMRDNRAVLWGGLSLGVLMFGGIALQQTALLYTKVANAAFLTALYVPFVPLITWVLTRQSITLSIWLAVILSIGGSYLLSGNQGYDAQFADILVAIGAVFWAGHIIAIGFVTKLVNAPLQLALLQNAVCSVLAMCGAFVIEQPDLMDFVPAWQELLYAGAISVGIAYTLQLVAQRHAHATTAAFLMSLEAVFAALAGWLFLAQNLTGAALVGCLMIFCAVMLADVLPEGWRQKIERFSPLSRVQR